METLKKLKAEVQELEENAKKTMNQAHPDKDFYIARENLHRGKFIAYGHVISLIDQILNKTK